MSAKIMGQVWDLVLSPAERSVLLAMADHADHDGNNVRPSIALIAWKTDYSERQVQRIIGDLRKDGLLIIMHGATPTTPNHYRINIEAGVKKEAFVPAQRGRHFVTPMGRQDVAPNRGDKMSPGDIAMSQRGDIAMSPDPSVNHHKRESAQRAPHAPPERQQNLDSFSQAVLAYKELSGVKHIAPVTITLIATRVTDVNRWRETIHIWAAAGFKVSNVSGLLDWYDHPEKMSAHRTRQHTPRYTPDERVAPTIGLTTKPAPAPDAAPPMEAAARMLAMREKQR